MEIQNKVIIWGNDNYNTLGVLRMLSRERLEVFVLINNKKRNCASLSKYFKQHKFARTIDEGINFLLTSFCNENNKPILLTTSDLLAEAIDRNKKDLSRYFYLSCVSEDMNLEALLDKNLMTNMAKECGINVPYSVKITKNDFLTDISYPCIVKPNKNRLGHAKEFKSLICNTKEDLIHAMSKVKEDSEFILQQYINKEYEILLYGCRLRNGDVFFPGCFLKDRWLNGGDATHGTIQRDIPSIIDISSIAIYLEQIGYYGLFSVEYGVEQDKAYFYEFNLRNDGTSHYFYPAGVNLPYLYIIDTLEYEYNISDFEVKRTINFIDEIGDKTNIDGVSLTKRFWKEDYEKSSSFKLLDKDDMIPYYWNAFMSNKYLECIKGLVKAIIRR